MWPKVSVSLTKKQFLFIQKKFHAFRAFEFRLEANSDPPSKGASPFSSMGEITVDPKGVAKLLGGHNVHKATGADRLNARVLKECSTQISPILALIYNES